VDYAPGDIPAAGERVLEGLDGQPGLHPVRDRVSDDPAGGDVFDRAEVKLALPGAMLSDVHSHF